MVRPSLEFRVKVRKTQLEVFEGKEYLGSVSLRELAKWVVLRRSGKIVVSDSSFGDKVVYK